MTSGLSLILVVAGAYLAAHVAFRWLAQRFLVVSGAEYLLLGILLGPEVSGLIGTGVFDGFAPFLTLALGWIGALVGAQFRVAELIRFGAPEFRTAFAEALLSLVVVGGAMLLVLVGVMGVDPLRAAPPAIAMGAIATASSPAGIALVAQTLARRGPVVRQLQLTTAVDALVAITAFGLLLALDHGPGAGTVRPLTATEWAVVTLAIGFVGGALFHLFLGDERKSDRLLIALTGALILASGAAAYLRLSPLLPALLIGAILVNTSASRAEIRQVLSSVERPLYFVLLIFAGAAWRPIAAIWLLPVVAFLAARVLGKMLGAPAAAWFNGTLPVLGPRWGRALLGQGGLAVALALNFLLHERTLLSEVVFTAALISVLLTDVTSARLAHPVVQRRARPPLPADAGEG